jgi:hypothetical protein
MPYLLLKQGRSFQGQMRQPGAVLAEVTPAEGFSYDDVVKALQAGGKAITQSVELVEELPVDVPVKDADDEEDKEEISPKKKPARKKSNS